MAIIENVKKFFNKKRNNEQTTEAPEGLCPTCWGRSEWEGKFYDIIKDDHSKPGQAIYDSFISDVVNDHVLKTHNLKNKYICTSCNKEIPA